MSMMANPAYILVFVVDDVVVEVILCGGCVACLECVRYSYAELDVHTPQLNRRSLQIAAKQYPSDFLERVNQTTTAVMQKHEYALRGGLESWACCQMCE
jgi:hypothetical protein